MAEDTFQDAESYSLKTEGLKFTDLLLEHIRRISEISCKEQTGGYWKVTTKFINDVGVEDKTYVPDTREEYYNAVLNFYDLMFPRFKKHPKIETKAKEVLKLISELKAEYRLVIKETPNFDIEVVIQKFKFAKRLKAQELFRVLLLLVAEQGYFVKGSHKE